MSLINAARAIGGLLSITVLLGMVVFDFIAPNAHLDSATVLLMLTIITGLLGVDLITERLPLEVTVKTNQSEDDEDGE